MNNKKKFTLVIVDMQYDFCDPNGSMYVKDGEKLVDKIVDFINNNYDNIYEVVFTQDYHPLLHCSFKENGGIWPMHCVENSVGAAIPTKLIKATKCMHTVFVRKGQSESLDEYGAFANLDKKEMINGSMAGRVKYSMNSHFPLYQDNYETYNTRFVVCGLCGDYCVKETTAALMNCNDFDVEVAKDLILSIDGGEKFDKFIKDNNVKVYGSEK